MNDETVAPTEDFEQLSELHDMASHAVELLKAMANEWRLMILCQHCPNTSRSFAARK